MNQRSIAEQMLGMKSKYPQFKTISTSRISMKVTGAIRPTPRSEEYQFVLQYDLNGSPRLTIIKPQLRRNDKGEKIPHIYAQGHLCLYRPKYQEFKKSDFLYETIIPWASLWLYYYEVWLVTNEWQGGGEHPLSNKTEIDS